MTSLNQQVTSLNQQVTSLDQQVTSLNETVASQQAKLDQVVPAAVTLNTSIVEHLVAAMPLVQQTQGNVVAIVASLDAAAAQLVDGIMSQLTADLENHFLVVYDMLDTYIDSLDALVGARGSNLGIKVATQSVAAAITVPASATAPGNHNKTVGDGM